MLFLVSQKMTKTESDIPLTICITAYALSRVDRLKLTLYSIVDEDCDFGMITDYRNLSDSIVQKQLDIVNRINNNDIHWIDHIHNNKRLQVIVFIDNVETSEYSYTYNSSSNLTEIINLLEKFKSEVKSHQLDIDLEYKVADTNVGVSFGRNYAYEHAKGKYIVVTDDDDLRSNINSSLKVIEKYTDNENVDDDIDLIFNHMLVITPRGTLDHPSSKPIPNPLTTRNVSYYMGLLTQCTMYIRVETIRKHKFGFINFIKNEDIIWTPMLFRILKGKVVTSEHVNYLYLFPSGRQSGFNKLELIQPTNEFYLQERFNAEKHMMFNEEYQMKVLDMMFNHLNAFDKELILTPSILSGITASSRATDMITLKYLHQHKSQQNKTIQHALELNALIHEEYLKNHSQINYIEKLIDNCSDELLGTICEKFFYLFTRQYQQDLFIKFDPYIGHLAILSRQLSNIPTEIIKLFKVDRDRVIDNFEDEIMQRFNEFCYRCCCSYNVVSSNELISNKHIDELKEMFMDKIDAFGLMKALHNYNKSLPESDNVSNEFDLMNIINSITSSQVLDENQLLELIDKIDNPSWKEFIQNYSKQETKIKYDQPYRTFELFALLSL